MSYATEEILPMLNGVNNSKKQSFGLAALMVLCLALTSFMAGYAYSSAATASAIKARSGSQWTSAESCSRWKSDMYNQYCRDQHDCLVGVWFQDASGSIEDCVAASAGPSCEWAYEIMSMTC